MFILDSLLIGSLRFVLDKIASAAEAELEDDSALREQLLEAQMRLELGELSQSEYSDIERQVLARMREIRADRAAGLTLSSGEKIAGIEIDSYEEDPR